MAAANMCVWTSMMATTVNVERDISCLLTPSHAMVSLSNFLLNYHWNFSRILCICNELIFYAFQKLICAKITMAAVLTAAVWTGGESYVSVTMDIN